MQHLRISLQNSQMIGKISKGSNFKGCVKYVTGKDKAEFLSGQGVSDALRDPPRGGDAAHSDERRPVFGIHYRRVQAGWVFYYFFLDIVRMIS